MTVSLITLDLAMKMPIAVTQRMEQNAPTLFVDQLRVSSHTDNFFWLILITKYFLVSNEILILVKLYLQAFDLAFFRYISQT